MYCPISWAAIAGLSSIVIALCALGLTVWQIITTRQHNKLSVTPHLNTWSLHNLKDNVYLVEISNNGIGPALIRTFELLIDGEKMSGERLEPVEKCLKIIFSNYQYESDHSFLGDGYMMAPKEARNLVTVKFLGAKVPTAVEVEHLIKRVQLLIEYESIYKDKFTYDSFEKSKN